MVASGSWDIEVEKLHFLMKIKVWLDASTSSRTRSPKPKAMPRLEQRHKYNYPMSRHILRVVLLKEI